MKWNEKSNAWEKSLCFFHSNFFLNCFLNEKKKQRQFIPLCYSVVCLFICLWLQSVPSHSASPNVLKVAPLLKCVIFLFILYLRQFRHVSNALMNLSKQSKPKSWNGFMCTWICASQQIAQFTVISRKTCFWLFPSHNEDRHPCVCNEDNCLDSSQLSSCKRKNEDRIILLTPCFALHSLDKSI